VFLFQNKNMANPRNINAYLRIPKQVALALTKCQLSGYAWRIIWVIWLKTWGWHKDQDWISYGQLSEMAGISRPKACAEVKKLIDLGMVKRYPNPKKLLLSFNQNIDEWVLPKKGAQQLVDKGGGCSLNREQVSTESGTVSVPQAGKDKRYIKNIRQKSTGSVDNYYKEPTSISEILKDFNV